MMNISKCCFHELYYPSALYIAWHHDNECLAFQIMPEETDVSKAVSGSLSPGNYQVVAWDLDTTGTAFSVQVASDLAGMK